MDHRWGRNVYDFGLGYGRTQMATRLLVLPQFWLLDEVYTPTAGIYLFEPLPGTDDPYLVGAFLKYAPHFPYGYEGQVEPDARV